MFSRFRVHLSQHKYAYSRMLALLEIITICQLLTNLLLSDFTSSKLAIFTILLLSSNLVPLGTHMISFLVLLYLSHTYHARFQQFLFLVATLHSLFVIYTLKIPCCHSISTAETILLLLNQ